MRRLFTKIIFFVSVILVSGGSANAQNIDIETIINDLQRNGPPVEIVNSPLLFLFAREWDAEINKRRNYTMAGINQYMNLMNPGENLLLDRINALNERQVRDLLLNQDTEDAFEDAYCNAKSSGSSVGMIAPERVLKYWIISVLIEEPRTQWCPFYPITRC